MHETPKQSPVIWGEEMHQLNEILQMLYPYFYPVMPRSNGVSFCHDEKQQEDTFKNAVGRLSIDQMVTQDK